MSVNPSISLFTKSFYSNQIIYLSFYLSIYLSMFIIYICLFTSFFLCLSVCLSLSLSLSIYIYIYMHSYQSDFYPISMSLHITVKFYLISQNHIITTAAVISKQSTIVYNVNVKNKDIEVNVCTQNNANGFRCSTTNQKWNRNFHCLYVSIEN